MLKPREMTLKLPFRLHKMHVECNFGVKITPSRRSLNAQTFPCLRYVIVFTLTLNSIFPYHVAVQHS